MRKTWVDIAKGIGILFVVAGHTRLVQNEIAWSLIYSFHMPVFFMIAGYCYDDCRYGTYKEYFIRKCKALVWPYFMLTFAYAMLATIMFPKSGCNSFVLLVHPYPGAGMVGFWFVRVLFFTELIYAIHHSDKWRNYVGFGGLIAGLLLTGWIIGCNGAVLECVRMPEVLKALFFYHIGHCYRTVELDRVGIIGNPLHMICAIGVYIAILYLTDWPHSSFNAARMNCQGLVFTCCALIGSFAVMSASLTLEKFSTVGKALAWLGRNSLLLLAFHPLCGEARNAWIAVCPSFARWSIAAELLMIGLLMWLFAYPLKFFLRYPNVKRTQFT